LVIKIAKSIGQRLGYKKISVDRFGDEPNIRIIQLTHVGCTNITLGLFVTEDDNNYKISIVKVIIEKNCLADLTNEEMSIATSNGFSLCEYGNVFLSMKDATNYTMSDFIMNVHGGSDDFAFVITVQTTEGRKTVSDILLDYSSAKSVGNDVNEQSNIIEPIVLACYRNRNARQKKVQYQETETDIRTQIYLLDDNNNVYYLYLILDKASLSLYYLNQKGANWEQKLLPNTIREVSNLFQRKA
jgi:hypothetical protein